MKLLQQCLKLSLEVIVLFPSHLAVEFLGFPFLPRHLLLVKTVSLSDCRLAFN